MPTQPWYKVVSMRDEVREGRSFSPDEFAIALEQVVAGTAPKDYGDPEQFFARNVFTRALLDHSALVLKRLAGETTGTSPVLALVTQFGGGKTHTLTTLYHLVKHRERAGRFQGVSELLSNAGLSGVADAKVAVFVGNAWDPGDGRETPWIDLARQLAGDDGVAALGASATDSPPGTDTLGRVFEAAGGKVLVLLDEVLNFTNRHRSMAEPFFAFLQNLTVSMTGNRNCAAVISLPRSQVEMTDWDLQWQDRITKVVRRVARDLIANDEAEISEVVRRRLFEDLGSRRVRQNVARAYAKWCFERRAQLPSEWTSVDTALGERRAQDFLESRFDSTYPFHPASLSVFQRKWQALPQYQQTRGTLAMLAQWISGAYRDGFEKAGNEPLITLGSAPLDDPDFRAVVLGQLGESRLQVAIETDFAGERSHARALDTDTKGVLREIHRRVGSTILFESSGGQTDKVARLPELRFALGAPEIDTTTVDNAAIALQRRAFFIRKVGSDGFQLRSKPTPSKVVNDRRASLDEETEISPALETLIKHEFGRGASIPVEYFPSDATEVADTPKLKVIVLGPEAEWTGNSGIREQIVSWTKDRGTTPRLYPGALVWCIKKPGRDLREKVELQLAWQKVDREIGDGTLGEEFEASEIADVRSSAKVAEQDTKDEVWAGYRHLAVADSEEGDGLRVIDLGAGHASSGETLVGRIIAALKSIALLNESVGSGYLGRNWPPALKDSGAWPLTSLRQSFLDGSLTRLLDPDTVLKNKIVEFVESGEFGLGSGTSNGKYERVWFAEPISPDEVAFESDVFLLTKENATALKELSGSGPDTGPEPPEPAPEPADDDDGQGGEGGGAPTAGATRTVHLRGSIPPELWNRFGTRVIAKLRSAGELSAGVDFSVSLDEEQARNLESELRQVLSDLGLTDFTIE